MPLQIPVDCWEFSGIYTSPPSSTLTVNQPASGSPSPTATPFQAASEAHPARSAGVATRIQSSSLSDPRRLLHGLCRCQPSPRPCAFVPPSEAAVPVPGRWTPSVSASLDDAAQGLAGLMTASEEPVQDVPLETLIGGFRFVSGPEKLMLRFQRRRFRCIIRGRRYTAHLRASASEHEGSQIERANNTSPCDLPCSPGRTRRCRVQSKYRPVAIGGRSRAVDVVHSPVRRGRFHEQ